MTVTEQPGRKWLFFNEPWDIYFRLRCAGIEDFSILPDIKISRVYNWSSLHYVRKGKGVLYISDKMYTLKAGDFFFIPPHTPTRYFSDSCDPWEYCWFSFNASSMFPIAEHLGFSAESPKRSAKNPQETIRLFDEIFNTHTQGAELCYLVLSSFLRLISTECAQFTSSSATVLPHDKIVSNVKKVIELNYTRPDFSVEDIAAALYISRRHMDRIFKSKTDTTPKSYITNVRLNHAASLLRERDYSIKELCMSVGFNDEPHFMKCFKRKFGVTVSEYRKKQMSISGDR